MLRMFKVYNDGETGHEIVFAKSPRIGAEITQAIWEENGYRPRKFVVWELVLPASVLTGRGLNGLVLELSQKPTVFVVRGKKKNGEAKLVRTVRGDNLSPWKWHGSDLNDAA